jgi:hypothetical protein
MRHQHLTVAQLCACALLCLAACSGPGGQPTPQPDAGQAAQDTGGAWPDGPQDATDSADSAGDATEDAALIPDAVEGGEDAAQVDMGLSCRDPADCPQGYTCQARQCVFEGCSQDQDCGRGFRCQARQCVEIGAVACGGDQDCGWRWSCSQAGLCVEGPCAVHADCDQDQWCRQGVCQERRLEVGPVQFERLQVEPFTSHVSAFPEDDCCGCALCEKVEGFGGALLDFDGDMDLDLFLGSRVHGEGSWPCLYRNDSTPGALRLTPVEALCGQQVPPAFTGAGLDLDQDGRHELLLMGAGQLHLVTSSPQVEVQDLLALLPQSDPRRRCMAGAALATDLDQDGLQDLLVGCQLDRIAPCCARQDYEGQANIAFVQRPGEGLVLWDDPDAALLRNDGISLALAGVDINEDGLGDVVVINDTFTRRDNPSNLQNPGGLLVACAPDEGCLFREQPFDQGNRAWGSFMGAGVVHVDGLGDHLYVTDWGPNRMLRYLPQEGTLVDAAPDLGVELATDGEHFLFAWSAVVEDFDRNGLDDLYLTHGISWPGYTPEGGAMQDVVLLQRAEGSFVQRSPDELGLALHNQEDARAPEHSQGELTYSARGAVRADLDMDGRMELLTAGLVGVLRAHTEVVTDESEPPRCTLVPRGRYVPTFGHGYAVSPQATPPRWRRRDVQGQMRFSGSPWLLTEHGQGLVRFPSGAQVAFDCQGGPGPVVVEEPDWVQVQAEGGQLVVTLDAPWLEDGAPLEVALLDDQGQVRGAVLEAYGQGRWRAALEDQDRVAVLRLGQRWLQRRWPLIP